MERVQVRVLPVEVSEPDQVLDWQRDLVLESMLDERKQ